MNICKEHNYEKILSSLKNIEQSSHINLYEKYKNPLMFESLEKLILHFLKDETYIFESICLYKYRSKIWLKVGGKIDYNKLRTFRFKVEVVLGGLFVPGEITNINNYLRSKVKIYKRAFNIDKLLET